MFIAIGAISLFLPLLLCCNPSSATNLSLSLNLSSNTTSVNIASLSSNGTFRNSDNTIINVSTNNYTGYTLSIKAGTTGDNATKLIDSTTNNTIDTLPSNTSIDTNTFNTNTEYNNMWGYLPQMYHSEANTNYHSAPDTVGDILNTTASANTTNQTTGELVPDNYNLAIGARVDSTTPPGSYTNTFVITAVANNIPYTITYDANDGDSGQSTTNMPDPNPQTGNIDATTPTITLSSNKPARSGYAFMGWCTTQTADDAVCPSEATEYQPGGSYEVDYTTSNEITLYARWAGLSNITFTAGTNINTMMIANSSENYKPYYVTTGSSKTFTNATPDTKYIVTVVPEANYKLDTWSGSEEGLSGLASDTLLTTNYIVPASTTATLTATGTNEYSTDYPYPSMQDPTLTNATCTEAMNVTDIRDGKSYTVGPITNTSTGSTYCYMLSNLRLAGSTSTSTVTLNSDTSDLTPGGTFTMPRQDAWISHRCEAKMQNNGEKYYYNWYTSMANPVSGFSASDSSCLNPSNNSASLGSICPKNWALPNYSNSGITTNSLEGNDTNPGMLATIGRGKSEMGIGNYGYWWSSGFLFIANAVSNPYRLVFNGSSVSTSYNISAAEGFPIRCIRSN